MEIGFNAQYLLDFLAAVGTDEVVLELKDAESQGLLRPERGRGRSTTATSSCRCGSREARSGLGETPRDQRPAQHPRGVASTSITGSTSSAAATPRARPRSSRRWAWSRAAARSGPRTPPASFDAGHRGSARGADIDEDDSSTRLEVQLEPGRRQFRVDGRDVLPREYHGRLEVVVYSTDRLRVVRGPMRDRRQFLDRSAAALWPAYRPTLRAFERVLSQRNAALESRAATWTPGPSASSSGGRACATGAATTRAALGGAGGRLPARARAATRSRVSPRSLAARGRGAAPLAEELRAAAPRESARPGAAWSGPIATRSRSCSTGAMPPRRPRPDRRAACCWRWPWRASRCTVRGDRPHRGRAARRPGLRARRGAGDRAVRARWRRAAGLVTTAHPGWAESLGVRMGGFSDVSGG